MALVYFLALAALSWFKEPFQIDGDEGFNLIKALLLNGDFALYRDIWSDQPPLFSYLLLGVIKLFGPDTYLSRLVTLAMSTLLLWSAWLFLRLAVDRLAANIGVVLLVLLPNYVKLSLSILIGLPALALAILALASLALWHQRRQSGWLVASGMLFGLSICTKAFTLALAPGIGCVLIALEFHSPRPSSSFWRRLLPATLWSLALGLTALAILALTGGLFHLDQLVGSHAFARKMIETQASTFFEAIKGGPFAMLLLALAPISVYIAWRQGKPLLLYPAACLVMACISLQAHRPVWFHLTLLATVPAALLAAPVFGQIWQRLRHLPLVRTPPFGSFAALVIIMAAIALIAGNRILDRKGFSPDQSALLSEIAKYKHQANWLMTDRPIYAFRAGLPVPPLLAVSSWKRLASGQLSDASVQEMMERTSPELVLLVRWRWEALDGILDSRYRLVVSNETGRLYVRSDLVP